MGAPCRNQKTWLPLNALFLSVYRQVQKWPVLKWNIVLQTSAEPDISLNFQPRNTGINGTRRKWIKIHISRFEHVNQMGLKWVNYSRVCNSDPTIEYAWPHWFNELVPLQLNNPKLIRKIWNRTRSVNQVNLKFMNHNGLISIWTIFI